MFKKLLQRPGKARDLLPLWTTIVAEARRPEWYASDGVADTLEGRFDMVSAVTALVLLKLEDEDARAENARLTELFITDMEGQLREAGVGDLMVGKRMGKLVAALGGRVGAYREGLAQDDAVLAKAAERNVSFGDNGNAVAFAARLRGLFTRIGATPLDALLAGEIA